MKAQYGILRFKKYKGPAISPIEAHNERTKEQYASNPDIDTNRSRYNLHLVQPQGRYREEADRMIAAAHCRVRKDSVRMVEALVTASPEFFKDKTNREIRAYFAYALKFLEGRQRPDTFLSAVVHMDEKTPHLHLCFVPLAADGRLSAKEIIGNRKNLVKWQDEFWQHLQQYGIAGKESRGQLSYLPAGRTKFIRAKHLGDKFDKAAVLATLQANAERKPKAQFKQDAIGKLIDIQSRMAKGKGIGYERWAKKHNLKAMAQTLILLEEKGLTDEDALNQRITELETKYHDSLAVVKDLEGRMKANKELRYQVAAYTSTKNIAQQLKAAKRPAAFEEQHRAELTAYRAAAAYSKANDITKLPSPKKLEAEYAQLASEKAKFYEQYKEAKSELLKLKTAKQNVASFFREEEQTQQER